MITTYKNKSLKKFGSAEEIFMFENWFKASLIVGPKYRLALKDAYFSYENYLDKKGANLYKLTKKRFKAFLEDMFHANGIQEPFVTSCNVFVWLFFIIS